MKVYELFKKCDSNILYNTIVKHRNPINFPKQVFERKLRELQGARPEDCTANYHLVFTPYLSMNGSGMEKDMFLLRADEIAHLMRCKSKPMDVLLFSSRIQCDTVSLADVMHATVCELSKTNFDIHDICAEIMLETIVDIDELEPYTKEEARSFVQKIREQLKLPPKPTEENIDYVIAQNVVFAYPYYSSVAKDAMNS